MLKDSETSGRCSNVRRLRKADRVRKSRKGTPALSLAVRRTKSIGALEHQSSLEESVKNDEFSNIAQFFNIGSGRTLRRQYQEFKTTSEIGSVGDERRPGWPTEVTAELIQPKILSFLASRKYQVTV